MWSHLNGLSKIDTTFCPKWNCSIGTIHICSNTIQTRSWDGAYPKKRYKVSYPFYHNLSYGEYFGPRKTTKKVLCSNFYWLNLFKDAVEFFKTCAWCQKIRQNRMMLHVTYVTYPWCWDIQHIGDGFYMSIIKLIQKLIYTCWLDYVSKWTKEVATISNATTNS